MAKSIQNMVLMERTYRDTSLMDRENSAKRKIERKQL